MSFKLKKIFIADYVFCAVENERTTFFFYTGVMLCSLSYIKLNFYSFFYEQ